MQKTLSRLTARGALHARSSRMLATFSLDVSAGKRGSLIYRDPSRHLELRSTRILTVVVDHAQRRATVTGRGLVNGRAVKFTLRVTDRAGTNVFAIQLSNGYVLSGSLVHGSVSLP